MAKRTVAIIGSGNWGSTIAKIVGTNSNHLSDKYVSTVQMWVFEEEIDGRKLTDIINKDHVNVKYLPGIKLPTNVVANPDLESTAVGADILVFVLPHQFLTKVCTTLQGKLKRGAGAVSLIKGLDVSPDGSISLLTDKMRNILKIDCAALMGANLANEVATENYCEATIGCKNKSFANDLKELFQTPYFRIVVIEDEAGCELCGALKNIVAIGAGFSEGLGYGGNTKAAVIRLGFMEMIKFAETFFGDRGVATSTFLESCGVADLITTCYGGRNLKVSKAHAQTRKPLKILEKELLGGQSAQGILTAAEVYTFLQKRNLQEKFPMFSTIHRICVGETPVDAFIDCLRNHPEHM